MIANVMSHIHKDARLADLKVAHNHTTLGWRYSCSSLVSTLYMSVWGLVGVYTYSSQYYCSCHVGITVMSRIHKSSWTFKGLRRKQDGSLNERYW